MSAWTCPYSGSGPAPPASIFPPEYSGWFEKRCFLKHLGLTGWYRSGNLRAFARAWTDGTASGLGGEAS